MLHSIQDSYAHDGFWGNNNLTHLAGEAFQKLGEKIGLKTKSYPDDPNNDTDAFYASYVASCKALNEFNKAVGKKDRYDIVDKETFIKGYKEYMDTHGPDAKKKAEEGINGKSNSETQETTNQDSKTSSSGSSPNNSSNNSDSDDDSYGGYEPPSDPSAGQG